MGNIEKVLLIGSSVDGKITIKNGSSSKEFDKLLNPEMSSPITCYRKWADAILVGSNTVDLDNPSLRSKENQSLKRLVIDRTLRLRPEDKKIFANDGNAYVITLCKDIEKIKAFEMMGVKIIKVNKQTFFMDVDKQLLDMGVKKLLIEAGGTLFGILLKNKYVDRICIAHFPFLIGGVDTPTILDSQGIADITEAVKLQLIKFDVIGKQMIYAEYSILYD